MFTMSNGRKTKDSYAVREPFKDIFGVWLLEKQSFKGDFDMPVVGIFDGISAIDYLTLYSDTAEYQKTGNAAALVHQTFSRDSSRR